VRERTCSLPETLRPFLHRRTAGVSSAKEVRGARRRASDEGRYVMGLGRLCAQGVQNGRLRKDRFGELRDTSGTLAKCWSGIAACFAVLEGRPLIPVFLCRLKISEQSLFA
jgi:hypothetical protein